MSQTLKKHYIFGFLLFFVLVLADQVTKLAAVHYLKDKDGIVLLKGVLELNYLENTGAAFSILEGKMIVFYLITLIIGGGILFFMIQVPKSGRYLILDYVFSILLAGAVGNLLDRIIHKYVVDFIYFSLINFPVFNVADIYVTLSVIAIVLLVLFYYSDDELNLVFSLKKGK